MERQAWCYMPVRGSVWMNQNQLAELFETSKQTISYYVLNILNERELDANSVVKEYLTTAAEGKAFNARRKALAAAEAEQTAQELLAIEEKIKGKSEISAPRFPRVKD